MIEPGLTRSELFNFAYQQQKIIDRLRAENAELVEILKAICDCYGVGSTGEQFARQVAPFIGDAIDILAKAKKGEG